MACACECGDEPSGSIKVGNFLTSCRPVSFLRRSLLHGVSKYINPNKMHMSQSLFLSENCSTGFGVFITHLQVQSETRNM